MKIVQIILGIMVGLFAITLVAESIELVTVKFVSGKPFADLINDQQAYFEIRNQGGVLIFKGFYTFTAAIVGGYLAAWIAKSEARIAMYGLIGFQMAALLWAGFFSDLANTGPLWMWIMLLVITPLGIYIGASTSRRK